MTTARPVLERLLRRAERGLSRGEEEPASLAMTGTRDAAEYLALRSLRELESFHAEIALAEREGAIFVHRDRRRADGEKLLRLTVADMSALARHLGTDLHHQRVDRAAAALEAWSTRFPVITLVLERWRGGRKVRGCSTEAADDLASAAKAVAVCSEEGADRERILRRESVRLFGDSKKLENLTPWLEILVTGELAASGLEKEKIWASIGLRREPQPLLIAGDGVIELDDGACLRLPRPYLGIPMEALRRVTTQASYVLSIENLTSFHDATRAVGSASALLLYTGGMPSPAWRAAYMRILENLPHEVTLYHWGDIDEGGFRIAAVLAKTAKECGRALCPWQMSSDVISTHLTTGVETPSPTELGAMMCWAERAGWPEVAAALQKMPTKLEQESLSIVLPKGDVIPSRACVG